MLQTGIAGLGDQLLGHSAPRYERHRPEQTLLRSLQVFCDLNNRPSRLLSKYLCLFMYWPISLRNASLTTTC